MTSLTTSDHAAAEQMQALQPGDPRLIGPYRLLWQIGCGGMGRVFLGVSPGGRPVAVKVMRAELAADRESRTRFRREVAAARAVGGLFTALVVDADVDGPTPWLATAYVAGPSLAQAVRDYGPLPADSVLSLAAGLAEGLAAIHAAGLVHRDLKPSNVLLAEDGPRVIDFGISRTAETTSLTMAGFMVGSSGFMSPEQAGGDPVGPPSDMFSLGAVLAFAATGDGPFGNGSSMAQIYRIVHNMPDLNRLPNRVRPLVECCLAKDPADRPSAVEFLARAGAIAPMAGWLPEPVGRAVAQDPASAVATVARSRAAAADEPAPVAIGDSAAPPVADLIVAAVKQRPFPRLAAGRRRSRFGRRRIWRPLAVAGVSGTLLAASATAGFALAGSDHPAPRTHSQPQVVRPWTASPTGSASGAGTAVPSPVQGPHRSPSPAPRVRPRPSTAPPAVAPTQTHQTPTVTPSARPTATPSPRPRPSPTPSVTPTAPTYDFAASGASRYSCSDEGVLHSVASQAERLFTFVNNSAATVEIIWLNFAGSRVLYDVLGPGGSYNVDTYVGHDWLIASSGGGCLGIFGIDGSGEIVINS